jgi:hypothetical protein
VYAPDNPEHRVQFVTDDRLHVDMPTEQLVGCCCRDFGVQTDYGGTV